MRIYTRSWQSKGYNKCLRNILRIKWQDHISTGELLNRAEMRSMSHEVRGRRWKMIGHILRQRQNNDSNVALTWAPEVKRKGEDRRPREDVR